MQAIVLAGGLGTRLRGVVPDLPKPMAPVAGQPFLAWILDRLADARFERVVLAVGYRHEAIRHHFGPAYRGMPLHYSVEESPLGTGGAIRLAGDQVGRDPVFVLNGDTFLELDYGAMREAHSDLGVELSVAVCRVPDISRYGALKVSHGRIEAFLEKGPGGPGLINAGTYILSRALLESIPPTGAFSFERELLEPRVADVRPAAFLAEGLFIDIGVPEDYARAQHLFPLAGAPS
jgi:D-glycero-alpha-D-manno-heptose 1-phosphate guanylyltransferase